MSRTYLSDAREKTERRFHALRRSLAAAEAIVEGKAAVYATGSFGRLEAGPDSDLDLFIVVATDAKSKNGKVEIVNRLDGVDEIRLKYHLIEAVAENGIAPFDGAGKYLQVHRLGAFADRLGTRDDDHHNTFTGRLLLLLESKPLLGEPVYDQLLTSVIGAYFRDYDQNETSFVPAFLVNDILRMWRTFAVNYELDRRKVGTGYRIKNLKLKYSRMVTCYSAIMHLLAVHLARGTVSPEDVRVMVGLTPSQRLEGIGAMAPFSASDRSAFEELIDTMLEDYGKFLEFTHRPKQIVEAECDLSFPALRDQSHLFGRHFAKALTLLGNSNDPLDGLYRIVLI